MSDTLRHTSWVEVDISALAHNLTQVRRLVGAKCRIMAVVKANAYGHGAVETARVFARGGADYFGVTTLEEGLELRSAGITTPVLIFSSLLPDQIEPAIEADLELTASDAASGEAIVSAASSIGRRARVHLKVDTGMGRQGAMPEDAPNLIYGFLQLGVIEVAGIYTHFASAGAADLSSARQQNAAFASVLDSLRTRDLSVGLAHAANSAATLSLPDARWDMVRPGTILYGQYPGRHIAEILDLRDTWRFVTRVASVRRLPAGARVGYGGEFVARKPMVVAILPVGYAEGFGVVPESVARRGLSMRAMAGKLFGSAGGLHVLIRGKRAPVVGRLSMQMCSVDITDIPDVHPGEEVIIPTRRVTTSSRIPRVYVGGIG